jgi:DNA-binding transcriptional regulator LsrR (DeoR family)
MVAMAQNLTPDDLVRAARELDQEEFTRDDVADHLGIKPRKIREAFKAARQSGKVTKVSEDETGTNVFRVVDQ